MQQTDDFCEIGLVIADEQHATLGQFCQLVQALDAKPIEPDQSGKTQDADSQINQPPSELKSAI